jgi:L-seryl-tRNA(Ser) seleniumtransferase
MQNTIDLRQLPQIERWANQFTLENPSLPYPKAVLTEEMRFLLEEVRKGSHIVEGELARWLDCALKRRLQLLFTPSLRRVINATGIVIHTNLGRAPLSDKALENIEAALSGYCNLEMDLATGQRGHRLSHLERLFQRLIGTDAITAVNNNAAAVLLIFDELGKGKEAIISRGEMIEIGGGFRIPDVMARSGVTLREVGTTNRTRLQDYAEAINPQTGLIVIAHPSNYRISGFTEKPALAEVAQLGQAHGISVYYDAGSGLLEKALPWGDEKQVREDLASGVSLISFSCDKLLGCSQGGIIAGESELIARLKKNPLSRAMRLDKLLISALEGTLLSYVSGTQREDIPVLKMLYASPAELGRRGEALLQKIDHLAAAGFSFRQVEKVGLAGGGALPMVELPSQAIIVQHPDLPAHRLYRRLLASAVPVVGLVENDLYLLDMRTIKETDFGDIVAALEGLNLGTDAKDQGEQL